MEIEAKFSFRDGRGFSAWLSAPALGGYALGPVRSKHVLDEYLDSSEHALRRAGYACRIRLADGGSIATLKSLEDAPGDAVEGVRRREEFEASLPGGPAMRQPESWPESEARTLAEKILQGAPLLHLAWVRQQRHERELLDGVRRVAVLSLDAVTFEDGAEPLHELEVELSGDGTAEDMRAIAAALRGDPVFEPETRSKLQRALQAAGALHETELPVPSESPPAAALSQPGEAAMEAREAGSRTGHRDAASARPVRLASLASALLEVTPAGGSQRERTLLELAAHRLEEGSLARPEDAGAGARDLVLAEAEAGASAAPERPLVAAVLGLQSLLDGRRREGKKLRLEAERLQGDPAYAALHGGDAADAPRLALLLFTARVLDEAGVPSEPPPAFSVSESRARLAGLRNGFSAPAGLSSAWKRTLGRRLELSDARPDGVALRFDEPLADAGRAILRQQLVRLDAGLAGLNGVDANEALHDARVATRRMRTLLRLIDDAYPSRPLRRHLAALKRLGDLLGAVRDLDVHLEALDAATDRLGNDLRPLRATWKAQQGERAERLRAHLDDEQFAAWRPEFDRFVAGSSRGEGGDERLCDALPELAWKRYDSVRAYQPRVAGASLQALHELRKDLKQLRYLLEFFEPILGGGTGAVVAKIVAAQDALGLLHDADARRQLLDSTRLEGDGAGALHAYRLATVSDITALRREFEQLWPGLVQRRFRRELARSVAAI